MSCSTSTSDSPLRRPCTRSCGPRSGRIRTSAPKSRRGYCNGTKVRTLTGPTGPAALTLPRATLFAGAKERTSRIVPRCHRRMPEVNEAVVATYLCTRPPPMRLRTAYVSFECTWAKRCPGVVTSLREGGDELHWKTLRTTNTIERLHQEFRRRVKTQGSLPSEDAALVLLFSLVASGQIKLRRIDGWRKIAAAVSRHLSPAAA